MKGCCSFTLLLGRFFLGLIFLLAGIGKFMDYDGTAKYMEAMGMTMVPFFLYGAAIIECLGGLSLILGFKTRIGAALLLLFLIPTTLIFHSFWNFDGVERAMQMINFLKNLAIFGGLLYVLCIGAGRYSFDRTIPCDAPKKE